METHHDTPSAHLSLRANHERREVTMVFPASFAGMADAEIARLIEEMAAVRKQWEASGYAVRYRGDDAGR
jgi:hypothetical protein